MRITFEWGLRGAQALAPACDVLVIVDVLSFTTAVDVGVSRGATVLPFPVRERAAAAQFAAAHDALLASNRRQPSAEQPYSLSPASLMALPPGARLVLPSPNGSTISTLAADLGCTVFAACLRNANAVARAARAAGERIAVIASGETWPDGGLRPAIEDLLGAGAVINALGDGQRSPEAELAAHAYAHPRDVLRRFVYESTSGRELIDLGFERDVAIATDVDVSAAVPLLSDSAYCRMLGST